MWTQICLHAFSTDLRVQWFGCVPQKLKCWVINSQCVSVGRQRTEPTKKQSGHSSQKLTYKSKSCPLPHSLSSGFPLPFSLTCTVFNFLLWSLDDSVMGFHWLGKREFDLDFPVSRTVKNKAGNILYLLMPLSVVAILNELRTTPKVPENMLSSYLQLLLVFYIFYISSFSYEKLYPTLIIFLT